MTCPACGAIEGEPPKDGNVYYTVSTRPIRWKKYKPSSAQRKAGLDGRWQQMGIYGGWENVERGTTFTSYYRGGTDEKTPEENSG